MNLTELLENYHKISKELIDNFKDCDLIIITKGQKTRVIEKGKEITNLKRICFSNAADEIPTIEIEKYIL